MFFAAKISGSQPNAGRHRHRRRLSDELRPTTTAPEPVRFPPLAAVQCTSFIITESPRTLFLRGELDLSTRHLLARAGKDLVDRCAARDSTTATQVSGQNTDRSLSAMTAVVDAAELTFIDATGLGVLVGLHHTLADAGIRLHTVHPSAQLRRVSAICGLDSILGVEPGTLATARTSPDPDPTA